MVPGYRILSKGSKKPEDSDRARHPVRSLGQKGRATLDWKEEERWINNWGSLDIFPGPGPEIGETNWESTEPESGITQQIGPFRNYKFELGENLTIHYAKGEQSQGRPRLVESKQRAMGHCWRNCLLLAVGRNHLPSFEHGKKIKHNRPRKKLVTSCLSGTLFALTSLGKRELCSAGWQRRMASEKCPYYDLIIFDFFGIRALLFGSANPTSMR